MLAARDGELRLLCVLVHAAARRSSGRSSGRGARMARMGRMGRMGATTVDAAASGWGVAFSARARGAPYSCVHFGAGGGGGVAEEASPNPNPNPNPNPQPSTLTRTRT